MEQLRGPSFQPEQIKNKEKIYNTEKGKLYIIFSS